MPVRPLRSRLVLRLAVAAVVASLSSLGATDARADEAAHEGATYRPKGPPRAALGFAGAAIFAAGYGATLAAAHDESGRFFVMEDSRRALYVPIMGPALYWLSADYRGDFGALGALLEGSIAAALTAVQVGGAALCLVAVADSESTKARTRATTRERVAATFGPSGASLRLAF